MLPIVSGVFLWLDQMVQKDEWSHHPLEEHTSVSKQHDRQLHMSLEEGHICWQMILVVYIPMS